MAENGYYRTGLTGGTNTDLDGIDGASLDGDEFAVCPVGDSMYFYKLDATSGATENSPYVITPDANAGTKRWILQQIPWKSDVGEIFFHSNLVKDPQRMPWHVSPEANVGPGVSAYNVSGYYSSVSPLSGATSWANINNAGAVGQVVSDDTYVTVLDVTSGKGFVTHLILPGVTATADTVSAKITVDSNVYTLEFAAQGANDRFIAGPLVQYLDYTKEIQKTCWDDISTIGGIAFRHPDDIKVMIERPDAAIEHSQCIRFVDSLKVEMKTSDVSTTNYRDYCGVVYGLDQY